MNISQIWFFFSFSNDFVDTAHLDTNISAYQLIFIHMPNYAWIRDVLLAISALNSALWHETTEATDIYIFMYGNLKQIYIYTIMFDDILYELELIMIEANSMHSLFRI